jgi:membrane associated rhomboid family serine protease
MDSSRFEETPQPGPWGAPPGPEPEPERRGREPIFNAPWPVIALVALIVGGYAVQSRFAPDAFVVAGAFSPEALLQGRWWTLFTSLFLHGGWAHAAMNAAFAAAFGTPVARFFRTDFKGSLSFFGFFLASGALAGLGYAALHPGSAGLLVGASGAVSGFMGAAARLIGGQGRVGPIFSRMVLSMGAAWILVNLIIAVVIGAFGGAAVPGTGGAMVAWEAHIAGFVAGVLLLGPFAWAARRV